MFSFSRKGRDSSVGMAARWGLDGPGIEFWRGQDFPHPASYTMGTGSFAEGKAAEAWL